MGIGQAQTKRKDEIIVINSLRGLAATAVCFYHFVVTTQDYIQSPFLLESFVYGKKGVQLFFIISGIVIPLSMIKSNYHWRDWWAFLTKRFIRIEPPYLAAILIGLAYLYLRNFIPGTATADLTPSFMEVVLHLGYLIPFFENMEWINDVFWTLAVEFQYYIGLTFLFPLLLMNRIFARICFYGIFIGIGFLPTSYEFFTYWAPYFLVGVLYALWFKDVIDLREYWIVSLVLVPVVFYLNGPIDFGIAVVGLLVIHYLSHFRTRLTLFLGKISYSLYLLHSIIGAAFINYLSHHFTAPYQKFLVIMGGFGVSVLSAYLLYRIVEKPTHQLARKWGQKA